MPGVIETQPGFLEKKEVVLVTFNPKEISYADLIKKADEAELASMVFTLDEDQQKIASEIVGERAKRTAFKWKSDSQPKYYLSKTPLRFVPMTYMQAMRVNASLKEKDHLKYLSPTQLELLEVIRAKPDAGWKSAIGKRLTRAWKELPEVE
jgi:hypothetical protein